MVYALLEVTRHRIRPSTCATLSFGPNGLSARGGEVEPGTLRSRGGKEFKEFKGLREAPAQIVETDVGVTPVHAARMSFCSGG